MKKEDIITLPNQNLRKKCERVHVITDEVRQIVLTRMKFRPQLPHRKLTNFIKLLLFEVIWTIKIIKNLPL